MVSPAERARKAQAADWFAKMRGPDAEASRLAFERWRAADPENRAAYARLESLWEESAALSGTSFARMPLFERRQPVWTRPGPRLAFASVLLVAALGSGALLLWPRQDQHQSVAQAVPRFETAVGEIRAVRLADGSTVTLDADSAIEVSISSRARAVRLIRGRARFDAVPDGQRMFAVEAGGQIVSARGTVFDVGLCSDGLQVNLLRGSVEISRTGTGVRGAGDTRLVAGQALTASPDGTYRIKAASAGADQWVSGMLSYDGASLRTVLEEANRYSPHKIRLGAPSLGDLRVTGTFRALPTDELASALAAAFSLRVERAPNGDFVLRNR